MTRSQLLYVLRALVSLVALLAILRFADRGDVADALRRTHPGWILAMYGLSAAALLTNAAMLRLLLIRVGLRVSLGRVALANALGTLYTLILPSDLLAGVAKWADLSAATGDRPRVLSALIAAKVGLALPPLVIGSLALAIEHPFATSELPIASTILAVLVTLTSALALNGTTGTWLDRCAESLLARAPGPLRTRALRLVGALAELRTLTLADRAAVVVLSLVAFALGVLGMSCAVRATGAQVALEVLLWVSMTLFLSRLIPVTLSNLGLREGILVAVFGLYGVDAATALLVGLIMFTNTLLTAIVGATYQIAAAGGWVAWRQR